MNRLDRLLFGLVGALAVAAHFLREDYPERRRRALEEERERLVRQIAEEA